MLQHNLDILRYPAIKQLEEQNVLSITDLLDFIDLDIETVHLVKDATRLPSAECTALARQFLATKQGISILHHMYRDQIADAMAGFQASRERELRRAYSYFSRKYPISEML